MISRAESARFNERPVGQFHHCLWWTQAVGNVASENLDNCGVGGYDCENYKDAGVQCKDLGVISNLVRSDGESRQGQPPLMSHYRLPLEKGIVSREQALDSCLLRRNHLPSLPEGR